VLHGVTENVLCGSRSLSMACRTTVPNLYRTAPIGPPLLPVSRWNHSGYAVRLLHCIAYREVGCHDVILRHIPHHPTKHYCVKRHAVDKHAPAGKANKDSQWATKTDRTKHSIGSGLRIAL
jgi:hypothetical protein